MQCFVHHATIFSPSLQNLPLVNMPHIVNGGGLDTLSHDLTRISTAWTLSDNAPQLRRSKENVR